MKKFDYYAFVDYSEDFLVNISKEGMGKIYKFSITLFCSGLSLVSMIPGDLRVAGCFSYFNFCGGKF